MSNLPPAARKQVKEAARQQAEAAAARSGAAQTTLQPSAPPAPPPGVQLQPVTNFVPGQDPPAPPGFTATPPAAPAAPPQNATDPATAPAPSAPPTEDFRQKYRVLQGKYNADVGRVVNENQLLRDQNAQLIARVGQPAAPAPAAAPVRSVVTPEEAQEYGPELIALVERIAASTVAPHLQRVEHEVGQVRQQVGTAVQQSSQNARTKVYESLAAYDSEWETVNNSDEFLAWLGVVDVISGLTRKQGLLNAFENNDAARVVGIFKAFKEEDSRSRSTARVPQLDPATLIAPGQPAGGAPAAPANQQGRIWSEEEIGHFNARVRTRKISAEERTRTEADIMLAVKEGRVRPTINTAHMANVPG